MCRGSVEVVLPGICSHVKKSYVLLIPCIHKHVVGLTNQILKKLHALIIFLCFLRASPKPVLLPISLYIRGFKFQYLLFNSSCYVGM